MNQQSIDQPSKAVAKIYSKRLRFVQFSLVLLVGYLLGAYLVIPWVWLAYAYRHPAFDETPGVTTTGDDHPGDPINVSLIGSEDDLKRAMRLAGWYSGPTRTLR